MTAYTTFCLLAFAAMIIALVSSKIIKLQSTITITASALMISLAIVLLGQFDIFSLQEIAAQVVAQMSFSDFLLDGVLGFLLFAGGLFVKLDQFKDQKWEIATLTAVGTLLSTLIVGYGLYYFLQAIDIPFDLIHCFLFGALISPTDPIAVLAIVKKLHAPTRISTQIEGESLFNDGFGFVLFVTLSAFAFSDVEPTALDVAQLFAVEALGGITYGFFLGLLFHLLISSTNDHSLELMLTLAIPTAGYVCAEFFHVSGPLAMVVSGIIIGNWTRKTGFSEDSKQHLDRFWEVVDEFLNGVLFLMIGLTLLLFDIREKELLPALFAIPLVLFARYISIKVSYLFFKPFRQYNPMSVRILWWGGLRGGLALALALTIPTGYPIDALDNLEVRDFIVVMTFAVVMFSILVQGSTITPMIKKATTIQQRYENKSGS